jgi:hypothetical protein
MARAMVYPLGAEMFEWSFLSFTSMELETWTDSYVYHVNQVQRNLEGAEWEEAWNADRVNTPL